MITRLYQRARRWMAYRRRLNELVDAHMDAGYNLSQQKYERYREHARHEASPAEVQPDDETRFDLIRRHPYLPKGM